MRSVRGDIYALKAPPDARGHEQRGHRYAVVVQSDLLNLSTLLVAPTTSRGNPASFRPEIEMDGQTVRVLLEQTRAVDPGRLGNFAGRLSAFELQAVDRALSEVLDLS
ncbi:type II toxin-antitoxin system PemK/MazF family toxin [Nesterenkonia muleiensis]|uniref:type II toxin-antitoxin system PemK/MazF family toxin n=1 Tax=Nesterenkonia muleiensis TaxID=2282648 RepID=UPI001EE48D38|nr:type II toxin-antitoxin system PemK/MazF family toxin [Nesterenkonia muleiensis]